MDTLEQKIADYLAAEAQAAGIQYRATRGLMALRDDPTTWKDKFPNFKAALVASLASKEKLTMAYTRLSVAEAFPIEPVEKHGFTVLYELCKMSKEIWPDKQPKELMVGEHRFVDATGAEHVLDFAKDHTREALKALRAAHTSAKMQTKGLETAGAAQFAKALKAAAESVEGLTYQVREKKDDRVELEIEATATVLRAALVKLGVSLQ
ncbi:MAG TPA: hypothetical protein VGK67_02395 [Myxococcales bacterium]|jgi:hypothetical protein